MGTKESNANGFDKLKCIWMASKIVTYKLCDKSFECEKCLFDKAMRNALEDAPEFHEAISETDIDSNVLDEKIHSIETEMYDKNLIYLANNFVLKKIAGNTYYLGFNAIVMHLIDSDITNEFLDDYKFLYKGESFFNLLGGWGTIDVKAPFNFFFIDSVNMPAEANQQYKWFAIAGIQQSVINENGMTGDMWEEERAYILNSLNGYREQTNAIGKSMYDGGEKIEHLHTIIGAEDYARILNKLINKNTEGM